MNARIPDQCGWASNHGQPTASNTIGCNACICWPIACALQPWCLSLTRSHWIQFESSIHRKGALQPQWWWCLEKNYWADSECALNAIATAVVIFHIDYVSPPVSPFIRFSPLSLRPGVVGVCFEVPGWMLCLSGCSLWSRGSWLGGSLVSALSFVASITLLPSPFVWFRVFFVLLLVRWPFSMTHKRSSCMLLPLLVAIPLLCASCLSWSSCGCVFLVCLFSFGSGCVFLVLAGTARWTVYRSTTSTFVAIDKLTALHDIYNSSFCCDWTCVTTWRKPWRRWTEKRIKQVEWAI